MSEASWNIGLLAAYGGLLGTATVIIFAGAHSSLPNHPPKKEDPEDELDDFEITDRLSSADAWLFPIIGSVTLFGLYLIVKYFGKEVINWLLGWYFSFAAVGSIWKSSVSLFRYIVGTENWRDFDNVKLSLTKGSSVLASLSCRIPTLVLLPLSTIPSVIYSLTTAGRKSVLLTNILSVSFSFNTISLLKLDNFKTGAILLSALFFYDIFWVFGTEVMVSVATSLDLPMKILWPKSLSFSGEAGYTMLGLGDIVLPGTFISLALRYDYHRAQKETPLPRSFNKPYFYTVLVAYILGLIATMSVLHIFKAAQPALLYLSPACILSVLGVSIARGEFGDVWNWNDEPGTATSTGKEPSESHDEKPSDGGNPKQNSVSVGGNGGNPNVGSITTNGEQTQSRKRRTNKGGEEA